MRLLATGLVAAMALVGCNGELRVDEVAESLSVCATGPVTAGIDVSHYEGTINWAEVKAAGIAFAFMKATENINFVDPEFAANWQGAGQNGIIRGAYHFFRPEVDPIQQADFFVQTAGVPAAGDLPLALDLEVTDTLTAAQVGQAALQFLQRVEQKTGRTPIVYTSHSFFDTTLGGPAGFMSYLLWVANWQVKCPSVPDPTWTQWSFWQSSSTGTVNGISGAMVDVDNFNGTLAQLQQLANGTASSGGDGGAASPDGGDGAGPDGGEPGSPTANGPGSGGTGGAGDVGNNGGPGVMVHSGCSFSAHAAPSLWSFFAVWALAMLAMRRRRAA